MKVYTAESSNNLITNAGVQHKSVAIKNYELNKCCIKIYQTSDIIGRKLIKLTTLFKNTLLIPYNDKLFYIYIYIYIYEVRHDQSII